ncbi:MAG: type IV toxin-antitoxin system AbiEi family antitoxin domain-containing protein [Gammaproteobacteria bacterium]|nr:type IV toxin-antitoxin system AbiEi family antitoxin domain-containing protein [Gammaproteobacteria bacterium]MDE0302520.1 type IV toxin-antitoxin system AbiEi family antitoxin domain-containing protein [Gammaproteobacteria bacterium]
MSEPVSQRERLLRFLHEKGMAKSAEIQRAGITAATLSRLVAEGVILQLSRGLYQLPDSIGDVHHTLAEASMRVPRGVVCLVSALAFHGLTDQMPRCVWMAIGTKDWKPVIDYPPVRIARFSEPYLSAGISEHVVEGVRVPVYDVAKTLADCFRHRRSVGHQVAIEGIRETLRQGRVTPAEIAAAAEERRAWNVMRPYVEALV